MSGSVVQELTRLLSTGDLTCELSDHGLGQALVSQWPVQLGEEAFVGVARTVNAGDGDVPSVKAAASALAAGDVLVVSATTAPGAVLGGNLAAIASERGAVGVIVDGWVRDLPQIRQLGLTVRARGVVPNRSTADGSGAVGESVTIDGVAVASGDIVVADGSGVVIIQADRVPRLEQFIHQDRTAGNGEKS